MPENTAGNYTVTATDAIGVRNLTVGTVSGQELGTVTFESKTPNGAAALEFAGLALIVK